MKIGTLALAMGALALTTPAFAKQADTETVAVRYSDLDLTTDAGRNELDNRLDKAAREVCGMNIKRTGTRLSSREARACYADARQILDRQFATLVQAGARGG